MPDGPHRDQRHDILGLTLDTISPGQAVETFVALARSGASGYCCVPNVHQCVLVHDDLQFRSRVNAATLVITDSTVLQRVVSLRRRAKFVPPLRGAELMMEICRRAAAEGLPIALVGGRDDNALAALVATFAETIPDLRVVFTYAPPFRPLSAAELNDVHVGLRRSGARICFVGLGCPKQENWMAENTKDISGMLIGVGAAFDVNAGTVRGSPAWVHRAGLEWLYRLLTEPRRLWKRYAVTSPRFIWLLLVEALRRS